MTGGTNAHRQAVRRYLEALEVTRRQLAHQDLKAALAASAARGEDKTLAEAEAAFIAVARTYSESEGITHAAWRAVGVEDRVLRAAGLSPSARAPRRVSEPRDALHSEPLLRCWVLLLVADTPRHAFEFREALLTAGFVSVNSTTVARMLHSLEECGLVSSQPGASRLGYPERRICSLTAAGEKALDACAAGVADLRSSLRNYLTGRPPREPSVPTMLG